MEQNFLFDKIYAKKGASLSVKISGGDTIAFVFIFTKINSIIYKIDAICL